MHDENRSAGKLVEIEKVLTEVIQKVDVVVAAARSALQWFEERGARNVFRLRNGVAPGRIQECSKVARAAGTTPRIGYVGVLSKWVDYELIRELAMSRPDWKFVIGGTPYRTELSAGFASMENVNLIGEVPQENLLSVLATFDVALGLNRRESWLDTDSMKLFNYLAAGVPVVTTRFHDDLDTDFGGLLEFGETASEFVSRIETILGRRRTHAGLGTCADSSSWSKTTGTCVRMKSCAF